MAKQTQKDDPYEQALATFTGAVETLQKGDFATARDQFDSVIKSLKDEPVLVERARMYRAIDPEGHRWIFATQLRDVPMEELTSAPD